MKRLLLVAHTFPPAPSPGALRPGYLVRYLPEFGWNVTTIKATDGAAPFSADVIRAHGPVAAAIDALPFRVRDAVLFPDAAASWMLQAYRKGLKALRAERFDAILSTAHPPSVHVVASMLAWRTGLPWIADFRDAWAGNPYLKRGPLRRRLEYAAERALLRRASAIAAISDPIAQTLRRVHGRPVAVIPNGFDPSEWDAFPDVMPDAFELVFTGSMHDGKRTPDLLFEAIRDLAAQGDPAGLEARVAFYGPSNERAVEAAARYGIADRVRSAGVVSRPEAMAAQRKAAALLIFLSMDAATHTEMGSKYLEYAGARRPILAFGPEQSVMRAFLHERGLGWFASNAEQARDGLRQAFARFRSDARLSEVPALPTARDLARGFAALLDEACAQAQLDRDGVYSALPLRTNHF